MHCDPLRIYVDGVVHVVPRRDEGLDRGNIDGCVREYAFGVERDDFDVRAGVRQRGEVPEDREAWLGKRAGVSRRQLSRVCPISHVPCTSCAQEDLGVSNRPIVRQTQTTPHTPRRGTLEASVSVG